MDWKYVVLLVCASLLTVGGQVLLKLSMAGRTDWIAYLNPGFVAGFVTYGAGALMWVFCLTRVPFLKAYPFVALTWVLAILAGVVILKETAALTYWAGLACVLFGLALVVM